MDAVSAIRNVLDLWALGYDEREVEWMQRCFTEDAIMTLHIGDAETLGPFVGRDEVMKHFTDHHLVQTDQRRHLVTNVIIEELDDGRARSSSILTLMVTEDGECRTQATGVYRDRFVRTGDRWAIRERELRLDAHY